jgi:hypothetical protein
MVVILAKNMGNWRLNLGMSAMNTNAEQAEDKGLPKNKLADLKMGVPAVRVLQSNSKQTIRFKYLY